MQNEYQQWNRKDCAAGPGYGQNQESAPIAIPRQVVTVGAGPMRWRSKEGLRMRLVICALLPAFDDAERSHASQHRTDEHPGLRIPGAGRDERRAGAKPGEAPTDPERDASGD